MSRLQLFGLGFTEDEITGRLAKGTLHLVANNVYAVGHHGLNRGARAQAALLQLGPLAGVSYESAARFWDLLQRTATGDIHVSVAGRSSFVPPVGVKVHYPRDLKPTDIIVERGLQIVTPERTILDLMPSRSVVELTRMLEQMVTVRNRNPDDLHAWGKEASRNRAGRSDLLQALDWIAGPAVIRSEFERLFRSFCQERGLPQPMTNHRIVGWEFDAAWLEFGVVAELDSWRFHGGRWQFHQDRRKGLAANKAGFELVRLTWWQLKREQNDVHDAILAALHRGAQRHPATVTARDLPAWSSLTAA